MIEHINEQTPNGGARADVFYLDDNDNDVGKNRATKIRIVEYDSDDNIILETWGYIDSGSQKQNLSYLEEVSDYIKTNMSLDGFSTTKDLDLQLEFILKSIEPDVMKAVEKIMPKSH